MKLKYFSTVLLMLAGLMVSAQTKSLPTLEVTMDQKTITTEYADGKMRLTQTDGKVVELLAKFKSRGATALKYTMKPSFNMKLHDEAGLEVDTTLLGLRCMSSWILDAMAIDRICMRNRVAFDVWNEFSTLPYATNYESRNGTVGEFVEVSINGEYKGIYCMTDRINRKLLDTKKPNVDGDQVTIRGVIYKHGTNDIGNQNERCFSEDMKAYVIAYHDAWELTEPEEYASEAAWAPLDVVYAHKTDYQWVKDNFYLEQLAEYQVFIMAMSIVDNWGNKNSFISARNVTADGDKHRFVYTPWDLDTSLGGQYDGSKYDGNYTNWAPADIMKASGKPVPFSVCCGQDEYKTMLRRAWRRGREGAFSVESIREKLCGYRDLFLESGAWERYCTHWDNQRYRPCYVNDLSKEIDLIMAWYENRFQLMDEYFPYDPTDGIDHASTTCHPSTPYYNMQGMRVSSPIPPGIYIHNGQKLITTH